MDKEEEVSFFLFLFTFFYFLHLAMEREREQQGEADPTLFFFFFPSLTFYPSSAFFCLQYSLSFPLLSISFLSLFSEREKETMVDVKSAKQRNLGDTKLEEVEDRKRETQKRRRVWRGIHESG